MKASRDFVIVKIPNPVLDKRGSILMRTDINTDQHYRNKAEVVAIPRGMSKKKLPWAKHIPLVPNGPQGEIDYTYVDEESTGKKRHDALHNLMSELKVVYTEEGPGYHTYRDFPMEVKIGDMIYFNWAAFANPDNLIEIDRKSKVQYWKIDYQNIFCSIRNGEIIMIGSYVFLEPDMESWEDISIPTYYPIELTGGVKTPRPKSEWIVTKKEPEARELKGFVRHFGTPLKGESICLAYAEHMLFQKGSIIRVEVEGVKYFAMRQHRLLAVIED